MFDNLFLLHALVACKTKAKYHIAQNFGGRKLKWIAANKHFGRQAIGGLAPIYVKIARIKTVGGIKLW